MTRMSGDLFQGNKPLQAVKASAYQLQCLRGRWYIIPEGEERVTYTIEAFTREQMSAEFIKVLGALLKEVRPLFGFLNSSGEETPLLSDEEYDEYNKIYQRCGALLIPFCNRYGLFNVLTDRLDFFTGQTNEYGILRPAHRITSVGIQENWVFDTDSATLEQDDVFPRGIQDYDRVARVFFPMLEAPPFPCFMLEEQQELFHSHYAEPVEAILKNPRFYALLRHMNNRKVKEDLLYDDQRPSLPIKRLSFEIVPNGDFWEMNALPTTMIELLNVLYVANLLTRGTRIVTCHHPRCNSVFITDNLTQRYCCAKHATSALKWRYRQKKKGEENG